MKIKNVFIRAYCHNNLGDDLFIKILTSRYPTTLFTIIVKSEFGQGLKEISNLKIIKENNLYKIKRKMTKILLKKDIFLEKELKKTDYIVTIGGSMFWERGEWEKSYQSYNSLINNDKPILILGANFGPYYTSEFYNKYFNFFKNCYDVCFRDDKSKKEFEELSNVRKSSDIVFNYKIEKKEKNKQLSIIPMDMNLFPELKPYKKTYDLKIAEICESAIKEGYKVKMLSFCEDQGDVKAITDILNILRDKNPKYTVQVLTYPEETIDKIIDTINSSELVVSTRFHGMILGWISESKVFPIIYDKKMTNVIEDSNYNGYSTEVKKIEEVTFEIIKNNNYSLKLEDLINSSIKQFEKLDELMEE